MNPSEPLDLDAMREAAGRARALLKVLSNPDRMLLLCKLAEGEHNVGQLEAGLGIGQPTLSQQLGVLRYEGMVRTRREGKQVFYTIFSPEALAVMRTLYALYCPTQEGKPA
jgi:DNA-binding transcriptional ArsR family regulator